MVFSPCTVATKEDAASRDERNNGGHHNQATKLHPHSALPKPTLPSDKHYFLHLVVGSGVIGNSRFSPCGPSCG